MSNQIPLRRGSHRQFDKRAAIYEHRAVADADDRPLERRLFELDSAGLTEQAHDAIDLSLPPAARAAFRLRRYGVPTRPPARPGRREQVAETRAKAFADLRKAAVTPKWRSIGPDTIAGVNGSNASGHVSAIAIDPSDHEHLLVAGSAGGTWESRDAGASWTPRGDDQATTSIGALAFDPTNSNIVYCATGDGQGWLPRRRAAALDRRRPYMAHALHRALRRESASLTSRCCPAVTSSPAPTTVSTCPTTPASRGSGGARR